MDPFKIFQTIIGKIPAGLLLVLLILALGYFVVPDSTTHFLSGLFSVIRPLFILLDAVLLFIFIYALREGLKYRPNLDVEPKKEKAGRRVAIRKEFVDERWSLITSSFAEGTPDGIKLAILESDRLVDWILKSAGVKGENLTDRLEALASSKLSSLDALWKAHRIRNEIVHSKDYEIPPGAGERTLKDYEAFMKEIGAL